MEAGVAQLLYELGYGLDCPGFELRLGKYFLVPILFHPVSCTTGIGVLLRR
jgi:hypothetical protein